MPLLMSEMNTNSSHATVLFHNLFLPPLKKFDLPREVIIKVTVIVICENVSVSRCQSLHSKIPPCMQNWNRSLRTSGILRWYITFCLNPVPHFVLWIPAFIYLWIISSFPAYFLSTKPVTWLFVRPWLIFILGIFIKLFSPTSPSVYNYNQLPDSGKMWF